MKMTEFAKKYIEFIGEGKLQDLEHMTSVFRVYSDELSPRLRQRFCKDWYIPIEIFEEPYYSERLAIYNQHTFILHLFGEFLETVLKAGGEDEYFKLYGDVKDKAIEYLINNAAMTYFSSKEDMGKFKASTSYTSRDVYKETLIGKTMVSIDLKHGNYTALRHYSPEIVENTDSYEEFMGLFTDSVYFQSSKYIRQVIFGKVNTKRQVSYEKYLMTKVLSAILALGLSSDKVISLSTDEIIIDADEFTEEHLDQIRAVTTIHAAEGIRTRVEHFKLHKIPEVGVYVKEFLTGPLEGTIDLKCMTHTVMPYVVKSLYNQPISDNDGVFKVERRLAKWLDLEDITLPELKARPKNSWEAY